MKIKKRKKTSRLRGSRTAGYGFRQSHKGHGAKGGHGMAGTGKRADQKKQKALALAKGLYFGKQGLTSKKTAKKRIKQINLYDIKQNFYKSKIDLRDYKILGTGEGFNAEINAKAATKSAIKKMNKAGGKIMLPKRKEKIIKEETVEGKGQGE